MSKRRNILGRSVPSDYDKREDWLARRCTPRKKPVVPMAGVVTQVTLGRNAEKQKALADQVYWRAFKVACSVHRVCKRNLSMLVTDMLTARRARQRGEAKAYL